jgi:hypothetical protein
MWFTLRSGLANTAAIAALALLPFVSVAGTLFKTGSEQARVDNEPVRVERVVSQPEPLLAHFVE